MTKIGVLGAGTWGMALARMLCNTGKEVQVWSALPEEIDEMRRSRRQRNLPEMEIPAAIGFTKDVEEVCAGRDLLLFAVPSVYVRATSRLAAPDGQLIVDVAKGIEPDTLLTLREVIQSEIPRATVVTLSGPTHAEEVARDLPSTIVAACADLRYAETVQAVFSCPTMRVYTNTDAKGVELCGALKNIIALASGICMGLGYGDNTRAALITRGLAEIKQLGLNMGCLAETFSGLAGMGDLIVTATSQHSRNNQCGTLIGQGHTAEEAVRQVGMVVEGLHALPAAMELARRYQAEMPIVHAVEDIIHHGVQPREAVRKLMARDWKTELG